MSDKDLKAAIDIIFNESKDSRIPDVLKEAQEQSVKFNEIFDRSNNHHFDFSPIQDEADRKRRFEDSQIELVELLKAQAVKPQARQQDKYIKESAKKRKKLIPLQRETNEGLLLIYELLEFFKIEYLDELKGIKAWRIIVDGEFKSESIKSVSETKKSINLNDGEKLDKSDFLEKYRKRFKYE